MPAPTAKDAWKRAFNLIVVPSILVLIAVAIATELYGFIAAGLVLNGATLLILAGVAVGATYWNTEYTAMIAIGGTLLFFFTPSVLSQLVHPAFAAVNSLFFLLFLGYIWLVLWGKLSLKGPR